MHSKPITLVQKRTKLFVILLNFLTKTPRVDIFACCIVAPMQKSASTIGSVVARGKAKRVDSTKAALLLLKRNLRSSVHVKG